jgi:hypothetical protein
MPQQQQRRLRPRLNSAVKQRKLSQSGTQKSQKSNNNRRKRLNSQISGTK